MGVERIAGLDRYATSVEVAKVVTARKGGTLGKVFLATGLNFPDALVAGAAAANAGGALLLTADTQIPEVVTKFVAGQHAPVVAVGGQAAKAVTQHGIQASSVVGDDRYDTAAKLAKDHWAKPSGILIASGENFPDALTAGALSALTGKPIIPTATNSVPAPVAQYLKDVASSLTTPPTIIGGENAVAPSVATTASQAATPPASTPTYGTSYTVPFQTNVDRDCKWEPSIQLVPNGHLSEFGGRFVKTVSVISKIRSACDRTGKSIPVGTTYGKTTVSMIHDGKTTVVGEVDIEAVSQSTKENNVLLEIPDEILANQGTGVLVFSFEPLPGINLPSKETKSYYRIMPTGSAQLQEFNVDSIKTTQSLKVKKGTNGSPYLVAVDAQGKESTQFAVEVTDHLGSALLSLESFPVTPVVTSVDIFRKVGSTLFQGASATIDLSDSSIVNPKKAVDAFLMNNGKVDLKVIGSNGYKDSAAHKITVDVDPEVLENKPYFQWPDNSVPMQLTELEVGKPAENFLGITIKNITDISKLTFHSQSCFGRITAPSKVEAIPGNDGVALTVTATHSDANSCSFALLYDGQGIYGQSWQTEFKPIPAKD
ncbi:MAG: cell wall-binding repeat-containing protein [Actinomycetaceae bacterium]|nr:cell wall-binding repeat-containing protein [Actinomycetaceae bacterium]